MIKPKHTGRPVEYKDVNLLKHDPLNPRLPAKIRDKAGDESALIKWMVQDASLPELMGAIAEIGFFPGEPLLICPINPTKVEGPYYVVEGNRRLTAVKLLLNPDLTTTLKSTISRLSDSVEDKSELQELPVIVYEKREDILNYLGYRHVTGVKEWGTFEKAQYLEQLSKEEPYSTMDEYSKHSALARIIGSRGEYVARLLSAKNLFHKAENWTAEDPKENTLNTEDINSIQDNFSLLTTALYYSSISDYINIDAKDTSLNGLDENKFKSLITWIYKKQDGGSTILGDSRKLKELSYIVKNPAALENLNTRGDLLGAFQIAVAKTPIDNFRNQIKRAENSLSNANDVLGKITVFEKSDLESINSIDSLVFEIRKEVKNLAQ